jgi:hypothetical protein
VVHFDSCHVVVFFCDYKRSLWLLGFLTIKIFMLSFKCLSFAVEAPAACQVAQDCTFYFMCRFVICLGSVLYCAHYVVR